MSKGFYKNRRLKSFIFLCACFLVALIPHAYKIESLFYVVLTLSFVIVFYGLIVISRNFKRNKLSNNLSTKFSDKDLPVLEFSSPPLPNHDEVKTASVPSSSLPSSVDIFFEMDSTTRGGLQQVLKDLDQEKRK